MEGWERFASASLMKGKRLVCFKTWRSGEKSLQRRRSAAAAVGAHEEKGESPFVCNLVSGTDHSQEGVRTEPEALAEAGKESVGFGQLVWKGGRCVGRGCA